MINPSNLPSSTAQRSVKFNLKLVLLTTCILIIATILAFPGSAFATTSIKYGWMAMDGNKNCVLAGSQHSLISGKACPIQFISNLNTIKAVPANAVVYLGNTQPGMATALIIGDRIPGCKDAFITTFKVVDTIPITSASVADIPAQKYSGKEIKPKPKVTLNNKTLSENKDYTLSYNNHINAGTASVIIKGKGIYTGSITKTFKINPLNVKSLKVSKAELTLLETQQVTIKGTVNPKSLVSKGFVAWTSSNKAVATVNKKGKITACKKGTCYIMFMVMDGTKRCAKCKVTVKSGMDIVKEARKALGVKYVWGGHNFKKGMDCSGLIGVVYKRVLGVDWEPKAQTHWLYSTSKFKTIKKSQLKPGDILVKKFAGTSTGHVGIWTGNSIIEENGGAGKCIETKSKSKVKSWLNNYRPRHYVG